MGDLAPLRASLWPSGKQGVGPTDLRNPPPQAGTGSICLATPPTKVLAPGEPAWELALCSCWVWVLPTLG